MPPGGGQTAGKKGGAGSIRQAPRSRNTTPSLPAEPPTAPLPPVESQDTEYLDLSFELFRDLQYEDLVDASVSGAALPDSKSLDGIVTRLQRLQDIIEKRGSACDRGMRLLANARKARMDDLAAQRGREEERRAREAADDEERERKANKKKRKATESLAPHEANNGKAPQKVTSRPWFEFVLRFYLIQHRLCLAQYVVCTTWVAEQLLRGF
jgi:transcriptional adapter 3